MTRILLFIDLINTWVGRVAGWLILVLTFGVSYEVFVRYVLNAPTTWAYDVSYMVYGALFLLAGPYTLSRNGHVRGDMLYRTWKPRNQARLDLFLYIIFYFPGILALCYSGYNFAYLSVLFKEVSIFSPAGAPVFPLKALIPITGVLMFLQGFVEVVRCIQCMRTGVWPQRLHDVEETESVIIQNKKLAAERGEPV